MQKIYEHLYKEHTGEVICLIEALNRSVERWLKSQPRKVTSKKIEGHSRLTKKNIHEELSNIYIARETVHELFLTNVNYFEITIDNCLTWQSQVKKTYRKVYGALH